MAKELNHLNVKYKEDTQIFITSKEEFLCKVRERFQIDPSTELEIFEVKKTQKRLIHLNDLKSVMNLEIQSSIEENGTPVSKFERMKDRMAEKLTNNNILTDTERRALIVILQTLPPNEFERILKRKNTSENSVKCKSKKLQVKPENLMPIISRDTQTGKELMNFASAQADTLDVIVQSKNLATSGKEDPEKAKELMDKSFDDRRIFVQLKEPTVRIMREKYPLLFSLSEVKNEIDRIFCPGKYKCFLQNIGKYADGILEMAREDDPLLLKIKQKMADFPTAAQKKYAKEVGSILILSSLLHEDRTYLKLLDHPMEATDLPYLEGTVKLGSIFFDQHIFRIHAENQMLCEAFDFKEALLCLVGSFYIFDMKYPDSCSNTFIVFEKIYLEGTDTDEVDDFTQQTIKTIQLKAKAHE